MFLDQALEALALLSDLAKALRRCYVDSAHFAERLFPTIG